MPAPPEHVEPIVCLTGQHREMLAQVTDYFGLAADLDLAFMQPNQTLAELTGPLLPGHRRGVGRFTPDCVVAQGDTTTVMVAALAAFYRRIPLVHVEAGLRTGNLQAPWPEEMNRRVASIVTAVHCAPTERSAENSAPSKSTRRASIVTGNTVIDALLWAVERERAGDARRRDQYAGWGTGAWCLITGHRRENFGQGFQDICQAIATLATRFPDVQFLYPVHLNPNVQEPVRKLLGDKPNVHLTEPAPYPEFVWLMDRSDGHPHRFRRRARGSPFAAQTDAGDGDTTERPEALDAGAVELVGTSVARIVESVAGY